MPALLQLQPVSGLLLAWTNVRQPSEWPRRQGIFVLCRDYFEPPSTTFLTTNTTTATTFNFCLVKHGVQKWIFRMLKQDFLWAGCCLFLLIWPFFLELLLVRPSPLNWIFGTLEVFLKPIVWVHRRHCSDYLWSGLFLHFVPCIHIISTG